MPYLPFADALRTAPPRPRGGGQGPPGAARAAAGRRRRLRPGGRLVRADAPADVRRDARACSPSCRPTAPVLLILEDLHWADATTRHLVTFLLRMLHRERVAIIGTYRTDDLYRRHPLAAGARGAAAAADRSRWSSSARCPPSALAEHPVHRPERPRRRCPPPPSTPRGAGRGQRLLRRGTAGRHLGVRTVGRAAVRARRAAAVPGGAGVRRGPAGAAGGGRGRRGAADDLVRAASGAARRRATTRRCARRSRTSCSSPTGPTGTRFRHALLREAVYGDLLPGERTRLHARLAALLAGVPGAAAELAHHSLASHDVPGAFAASIRAGEEAERIGAPAEAHRHYDQALALWDRVADAERLAGHDARQARPAVRARRRGERRRAARGAPAAADPRPGSPAGRAAGCRIDERPELRSRVGERLAYYLLQSENTEWFAEALTVARDTVRETPDDPPTWYLARAMATYAIALMVAHDDGEAPGLGAAGPRGRARRRARGPSRRTRWSRSGSSSTGRATPTRRSACSPPRSSRPARPRVLGVRAAGRLPPGRGAPGPRRARARRPASRTRACSGRRQRGSASRRSAWTCSTCTSRRTSPTASWDHAQELADGFPVRVTSAAGGGAVGDGAVHRRGPRQRGGRRAADLA